MQRILLSVVLVVLLSLLILAPASAAHTNCPKGFTPGHTTPGTFPDKDGDGNMCKKVITTRWGEFTIKIDDLPHP